MSEGTEAREAMSNATIRILFAGVFAFASLMGAIAAEVWGSGAPEWLIVTVTAAVTYIYGHTTANTKTISEDISKRIGI